ncbi:MAG: Ig-like domain-containing protein, partial [Muribaculaceae bacterium]|nr:Ig-like domain-containing protein [Muribaculaceae bacterium]
MTKNLLSFVAAAAILCSANAFAADEITFEVNPESGSVITELSSFQVTFSCEMKASANQGASLVLVDGIMAANKFNLEFSDDKKTVTFSLNEPLYMGGVYTFKRISWLVDPVDGGYAPSELDDLTYTILEPELVSNPADGSTVGALGDIEITFNGNIKKHSISDNRAVTMSNGTDTWAYVLEDVSTDEEVKIMAKPAEGVQITEAGEYTLTFELGAISLNGKPYEYELHFTIEASGINNIKGD